MVCHFLLQRSSRPRDQTRVSCIEPPREGPLWKRNPEPVCEIASGPSSLPLSQVPGESHLLPGAALAAKSVIIIPPVQRASWGGADGKSLIRAGGRKGTRCGTLGSCHPESTTPWAHKPVCGLFLKPSEKPTGTSSGATQERDSISVQFMFREAPTSHKREPL